MNSGRFSLVVLLSTVLATPVAVSANDQNDVYESLPDVTVGRVFFTPEQRAVLDQQRRGVFVAAATRSSEKPGRTKSSTKAAGYISRGDGPRRLYENGDFVQASDNKPVVFPGTVKVVRGADAEDDEASDEDD